MNPYNVFFALQRSAGVMPFVWRIQPLPLLGACILFLDVSPTSRRGFSVCLCSWGCAHVCDTAVDVRALCILGSTVLRKG